MPSGLRLNLLGSLHMNLRTSSGVKFISDISIGVCGSISGRLPLSIVKTDVNWVIRMCVFSRSETAGSPCSFRRGATPSLCTRRSFTYL